MNIEMTNIINWLNVNKLSLNLKKTHFIIFRRRRAKVYIHKDLIVNGVKIDQTNQSKFLGVVIDQNLTFMEHIQYIKGKISRGLGILYKCKHYFDTKTLLTLYHSFIYPYFNYCLSVWGSTFQTYLNPLVILQKKAVRTIYKAKYDDHTKPIFKELKILNFDQLYVYSVQLFMYKYVKNALPNIFDIFFTRNDTVHHHYTRQQLLFRLPLLFTIPACNTIRLRGVHIFNYFSRNIDYNCVFVTYKYILKKHILLNDVTYTTLIVNR